MKIYTLLLVSLITSLLIGCGHAVNNEETDNLDGTYRQLGYGRVAVIKDSEFVLYDVTEISSVPISEGSIDLFEDRLTLENDTLKLVDGINKYYFVRIKDQEFEAKELTDTELNDPLYIFDVLAKTFDDHYAYFDLRKVNWDSLKLVTRAKINAETSEAELYIIMEDMLDSFNDGHIGLSAPDEVEEEAEMIRQAELVASEEETEELEDYGNLEIAQLVAEHYLKDNMKSSRSELIKWGILDEGMGYIQINLMMGHGDLKLPDSLSGMNYLRTYFDFLEESEMTSEEHTSIEVDGISATLDEILKDFSETDAIVLDMRFNGGGKDEVGLEIMRRFNSERLQVLTKKGRMGDGYTAPNEVYLEASENAYTKPVYLLTSPESASATEISVMSSMRLDHVKRVGGNTEGVFSDVLDKTLPNEWVVGLSNEVYLDTNGINYEGIGIPPQIKLDYPEDGDDLYRQIANDLEADLQQILNLMKSR